MTPVDLALEFARCGFLVFPLYGRKKSKPYGWARNEPVDPNVIDKVVPATDDPETIRYWDELIRNRYDSNVSGFGVLGARCVVLDVDVKNGKNGFEQLRALRSSGLPSPNMATKTKSGGLHLYYRRPGGFEDLHVKTMAGITVAGAKYDSIDLRGDGGFVVGPNVLVTDGYDDAIGLYQTRGLRLISELVEFPADVLRTWIRTTMSNDLESMVLDERPDDIRSMLRAGQLPESVPEGARNDAFYVLTNSLKSRGVPKEIARTMCLELAKRCENPETLSQSVDIDEMLDRVFTLDPTNPYDVAVDLVKHGMYQVTGWRSKIHYILLNDNPYISSKMPHDSESMKTLLSGFKRGVNVGGKTKMVNPMEVLPGIIRNENRVDGIGFKPGVGEVFALHDDPGSKRFLNTYRPLPVEKGGFDEVWDEYRLLVSRVWGPEGSEEFVLGMDFVAWLVQRPHIKPSVAPFLMSIKRGVGKSLFFNVLIALFGVSKTGDRQARLTKLDEITGRFFDPTGCLVNLIDEVQFPVHKDSRKESVAFWRHMKNLITAETVSVEIKGGATFQMPNTAALMLAGNTGNHFPIEEFDRRLWIIDANPPLLARGECDRLFSIVKGMDIGPDDRRAMIATLRNRLSEHKISMDLSMVRAPMTDVKREIFFGSLTDMEEFVLSHFENPDNLFARTPIITKSAFQYVVESSPEFLSSRWKEDSGALFRDIKRRGYLRPIRTKKDPNQSRNMLCPTIEKDGTAVQSDRREVVYTTRDHGGFDQKGNDEILRAFMENVGTIQEFKDRFRSKVRKTVTAGLDNNVVEMKR